MDDTFWDLWAPYKTATERPKVSVGQYFWSCKSQWCPHYKWGYIFVCATAGWYTQLYVGLPKQLFQSGALSCSQGSLTSVWLRRAACFDSTIIWGCDLIRVQQPFSTSAERRCCSVLLHIREDKKIIIIIIPKHRSQQWWQELLESWEKGSADIRAWQCGLDLK